MTEQITPETKKMLEELTGKSYELITIGDIEKISPGINDDLHRHNAKTLIETLKSW